MIMPLRTVLGKKNGDTPLPRFCSPTLDSITFVYGGGTGRYRLDGDVSRVRRG